MSRGRHMNPKELLQTVRSVLVIDWPSRHVPESLARAGLEVFVRGGRGPEDFSMYALRDGAVVSRRLGRAPEAVDLVYSYRPLNELPEIIATAGSLQAKTVWTQSGLSVGGAKDPKGCWVPAGELQAAQ